MISYLVGYERKRDGERGANGIVECYIIPAIELIFLFQESNEFVKGFIKVK